MSSLATEQKGRIPGNFHIPWLGWRLRGLSMLSDPMKCFMQTYQNYGPLSAWDPRTRKHLCAFGPELYREIITQPDTFIVDAFREGKLPRGSAMERLSFGLMRINGDNHKRHRRLMQPAFRRDIINSYLNEIIQLTDSELATWRTGQVRDVDHDLMRLITFISIRTMFWLDPLTQGLELQQQMKLLLKYAASPAALLLRLKIPNTPYYNMLAVSENIENRVKQIIKSKRESRVKHDDVLSILIESRDEQGTGLNDDELISEAYTVLCHESSAAALTWCLFLLDQHPHIYNDLYDEIHGLLQGSAPSIEQLSKLPLLDNVISETVRLLPPAGFALRYTSKECELAGFNLPKDAMIFVSSYVSHRICDIYEDPLRFDPQRWEKISPTPYEYVGFGAGAHSCLGRNLALLEMKVILCMLIQRFRLNLVSGSKIDRGMRISFVPKQGMPMHVKTPSKYVTKPQVLGNIHESVALK
jgi:cytochrome P450